MKRTRRQRRLPGAEAIAKSADEGRDISAHFTNRGTMMRPVEPVTVNFPPGILSELDAAARELGVNREDVIKVLVRHALDEHYLAQKARRAG